MQKVILLKFVLFYLMVLGANAQEFDVRSFEAESSDMAARRYPRTTVNDEPAAMIKVITNISGMSFDSNQGIVDVERKEAEYWVYVAPRERRIRLMAPEFLAKDVSLPEPAQSHTVYHLIVTAKGLPETLNVIPVNIIVEGHDDAVLFVNEEVFPINQTISLPRGENAIRIEKQGYRSIDQNIEVNEENTLFRFAVEGINEEVVTIRSYPRGASILINRVRQDGMTDFQTFLFPGTYDLRLILDEYKDLETAITVQENQSNEFVFELERYAGTLFLDITPDDATILINQRNYTGQEQVILAPGMYRLIVEKDKYDNHEERFQITEGQSTDISVVLNPKTGSLRFLSSSPDAAYVLFNSVGEDVSQWSGTHQIRELPVGSYRYVGALEGYVELARQIDIRENEQALVNAIFTDEMRLDPGHENPAYALGEKVYAELDAELRYPIDELLDERDGKIYKTVKIGGQTWMSENIAFEPTNGNYWAYQNEQSNIEEFGYLYDWRTANNVCPEGWKLPSDDDWNELIKYIGNNPGVKLRATVLWRHGTKAGTDEFGFMALPGGYRNPNGSFDYIFQNGYWWSSTEKSIKNSLIRAIFYNNTQVIRRDYDKADGFSVRCIKKD